MKILIQKTVIAVSLSVLFLVINVHAGQGVADRDLGLSKTDVNDSPAPDSFHYSDKFPGSSDVLPRAYPGAPPQIPHNIESFIPVTAKNNMCKGCHDNPAMMGKKVKGMATAIPASHYTDVRHAPGKMGKELVGARYVCTQCHVPQANAKALVENTFSK